MQSMEYVKASLESFPQGQDFLATVLTELKLKTKTSSDNSSSTASHHHSQQQQQQRQDDSHSSHSFPNLHQSHYHPHFHNDANSLLWVIRKIWNHYRLGTMAEVQYALSSSATSLSPSSSVSSALNPITLVASESKQVMQKETFMILLADVMDYYFRDLHPDEEKQSRIIQTMRAFEDIDQQNHQDFIPFSVFISRLLDLIMMIHQH